MSELGRKIVKAALNLALVMCLSLWAYYIQIKGEFTDRQQAPAPISNQTVPSGEPCGAHICGHSLTAWHHSVLQESSTRIMGSCERECSTLSQHRVMCFKIRHCIYEHWRNMSWFTLCSHCSMRTSRKTGGKGGGACSCAVVCLFEGSHSSRLSFPLLKSLSESLFVTLLTSFPLPLSDNTMWVLYPCLCAL